MSKEVSEEGVSRKDYVDPPPAPLIDVAEIKLWSFYRALIAEFIATLLFLYVTIATVIGHKKQHDACDGVGLLGIAWAFGGMIFILVYCTAGISGGHINPAVTFGLFLARKVSLIRAVAYMVAQCLGAICGVGLVKAFMKSEYNSLGGVLNLQHLCVNEKANDSSVESTKKTESFTTPLSLDEVEVILGYEFKNKQLLEEAFTDASLGEDFSNERLEYVGDSVLNLLFTKDQYFEYPDLSPGVLTRLRAANVDSDKLARVAVKHGFHRFLRHKKPLLEDQIRQFSEEIRRYPLHSNGLVDVPKALAGLVESIIGAVFIDSNSSIDIVWKVFKDLLEPIIRRETLKIHPVTQLYEMCQKKNLKVKFVDLWKESTTFDVFVDDQFVGRGSCRLKKEIAHNRAAKDALDNIVRILDKKDT